MTTKMLRNLSALLGLSSMILLSGCGEGGNGATSGTAVQPTSGTTTSTAKPAETAAATADKPELPSGVIRATAPDGREYVVDLRDHKVDSDSEANTPDAAKADAPNTRRNPDSAAPDTSASASTTRAMTDRGAVQPPDAQPFTPPQPVPIGPSVVFVEPSVLDLGKVPATSDPVVGNVKLHNTGDKPMKVQDCTSSCGCTAAKCPKGQLIAPGESADVEIKVTPGFVGGHKISKVVTFKIEGQADIALPVNAEVIAYIVTEPEEIDLDNWPDHKLVVRATDDHPFVVTGVVPTVIEDLGTEAKVVHEFTITEEATKMLGRRPKLIFNTDHPKAPQVYARFKPMVQPQPPLPPEQIAQQQPPQPPPPKQSLQAPIHIAARNGDIQALMNELQASAANVDLRDGASMTPLIHAAKGGHIEAMEILLKYGADVEAADKVGMTPLSHAAQANSVAGVRLLLDHHADPRTHDDVANPLVWSSGLRGGSIEIVSELIAAGADVNASGFLDITPLISAAGFGGTERKPDDVTETVKLLIKSGADVNKAGGPGQMTPLLYAVQRTTPQTVQLLIDAGADLKAQDSEKHTALDIARTRKDDDGIAIVKLLEAKMGVVSSQAPAATPGAPKTGN